MLVGVGEIDRAGLRRLKRLDNDFRMSSFAHADRKTSLDALNVEFESSSLLCARTRVIILHKVFSQLDMLLKKKLWDCKDARRSNKFCGMWNNALYFVVTTIFFNRCGKRPLVLVAEKNG